MSRLFVVAALVFGMVGSAAAHEGKARILLKRPTNPIESVRLVNDLGGYAKQHFGLKLDGMVNGKRRMLLTFSGNADQARAFEAFIKKVQ